MDETQAIVRDPWPLDVKVIHWLQFCRGVSCHDVINYDGRTISDAAFGMFRATGGESESTSPYEVGVGDSKTSVHVVRGRADAEIGVPRPPFATRGCPSNDLSFYDSSHDAD